ncbi:beta-lactamase family protein [Pseudoalteromonas sp. PAR1]|uniref:beta-lactamase family protein n=1 Tax=Pseudoalteromonas sp. PAR1 TaxID=2853443 RepID=UPI00248B6914|nr:beta-lactamase family protein [Pseudoalteromonas sp. PAR1]|tara:strand:- start:2264 stop:3769 length:1506 start_codon:yes stop_codon:yes gene_type:complete
MNTKDNIVYTACKKLGKKLILPTITLLSLILSAFSAHADELDQWLVELMQKRNIPGLQLAVVRDNKVIKVASYGVANIEDNIAVDADTLFVINSATKAFVGVALMQLVEQKKLDLNAPIGTYLPELPTQWHAITTRELMSHTSGLPDIIKDEIANLISDQGPDDAWQQVQTKPLEFETGTRFKYNQTNYVIIGKLINKLSGMPFQQFIAKNQLQKTEMNRTLQAGFGNLNNVVKHSARRYETQGNELINSREAIFSPMLQTAAGMASTATELANWLVALQTNQFINAQSIQQMWTPTRLKNGHTQGFNQRLNGYSLGWPVMGREEHPALAAIGGNRAGIFVYPEDNMSIVILTNLIGAMPSQFVDEIAGFYIPEMKQENGFGLAKNIKRLWQVLEVQGYENAITAADQLAKDEQIQFTESDINLWGYSLINQDKLNEALAIFKLNTHLYPHSYNTFDSLAEAYWYLGDLKQATANYNHVLKLKPDNTHAKKQLAKLAKLLQ